MFPTGKSEPDAGVVTRVVLQLSVAVTEKVTALLQAPVGAMTLIFEGQTTTGAWLSIIVTLNEQVDTLPETSVAV